VQHPADADENARTACIFDERNLLRVKEAERGFRLQMVGEAVEELSSKVGDGANREGGIERLHMCAL
jgi:hypothetical protein